MHVKQFYTYALQCKANGWMYVGKGGSSFRMTQHFCPSMLTDSLTKDKPLYKDIAEYGKEQFDAWIVSYCGSEREAFEEEAAWIEYLQDMGVPLYNIYARGGSNRVFMSEETEEAICKEYEGNEEITATGLAEKYECSVSKICVLLEQCGIKRRPGRKGKIHKSRHLFTEEIQIEICRKYKEELMGLNELAREYDCWNRSIWWVLKRHKIKKHTEEEMLLHKFPIEKQLEVCHKYALGSGIEELKDEYHCQRKTIYWMLATHNIPQRPHGWARSFKREEVLAKWGVIAKELEEKINKLKGS